MAQTESYTLSFRLPDAAAGDRPRYAGMNVERPLSLAAIGRFGSKAGVTDEGRRSHKRSRRYAIPHCF